MNCKQYRTEIEESGFAAGEPMARAVSHAAGCADCRGFGEETAALRGLVAGLARVDAPADFEFRLRARMSAADAAQARSWSHAFGPRAAWLAAAGCVALAAALALQTRNSHTPGAPSAAAPSAAAHSVVIPAAPASADAGTREPSRETATATHAAELSPSTAALNEVAVRQRRQRAAALANAAAAESAGRPSQRKHTPPAVAPPGGENVASSTERPALTESSTSSMIGSGVIVSSAIPLPVSADERPLQVLFKDTQGASRVVNVDPVAFGSNDAAARPTNVTFTKTPKKQGVW